MLELTKDQAKELERRILEKLEKMYPEENLTSTLCKVMVPVIICTLNEYARMSEGK